MNVGTQIIAPVGYEMLARGVTYYFLRSDEQKHRVLILEFRLKQASVPRREKKDNSGQDVKVSKKPEPSGAERYSVILHYFSRSRFEQALEEALIVVRDVQDPLPPWLNGISPADLRTYEQHRATRKYSHEERIDRMLTHIWPLVQQVNEVLGSTSPEVMINSHARACDPPQNETRLRRAFLAYICFGRQRLALHYAVENIGRWERVGRDTKFGRHSLSGSCIGYSAADENIITKSVQGYRRFAGPGKHMTEIYRQTLRNEFGCKTRGEKGGRKEFFHPQGSPFPSFDQFIYRVKLSFSQEERWLHKFGSARCRDLLQPSRGSFAEGVANLLQETVYDGYQVNQVPMGYLPGSHLLPLWVVRILCMASGMIVGIGFSWGSETSDAYRAALFCAAVDKSRYCRLFGMDIPPEDWPSIGLSPHGIYDRGPGLTAKGNSSIQAYRHTIKEGAPSYSGQSKAAIETSHPKTVKLHGAPKFTTTRLTVPQLAMQEIRRTIGQNLSKDISARLNPEAIIARVDATPIGLWHFLDNKGRNDGFQIPFDEAVRAFLNPIELTVKDDAVYYLSSRFTSERLKQCGILDQAHRSGRLKVNGFMLAVCLRHLWVDLGGELIEVDAQFGLWSTEEQLYQSAAELQQLDELFRLGRSELKQSRLAAQADAETSFEEETGIPFGQKTIRSGRPKKRSKASLEDQQSVKPYLKPQGGRG